jgi:hypothetical protein
VRALLLTLIGSLVGCGSSIEDTAATPLPNEEQEAGVEIGPADVTTPPEDVTITDAVEEVTADTAPPKMDALVDAGSACRSQLTAKGISYKVTAARGVVDAVNILGPINGVLFASGTETKPIGDPVACEFALTLVKFADLLKAKGFVRVGGLGSYCYRCCCAWSTTNFCRDLDDPEPVCGSDGYSNHSWGRALDVRYLYKADGTRYDINDPKHWVISSSTTCTTALAAQTGISRELYQLACEATSSKVFGIVLTPNYNSAHRNHFHMDIGRSGTPTSWSTHWSWDPGFRTDDPPSGYKDDHCGE